MITIFYVAFGLSFVVGLKMFLMSLGGNYPPAQRAWGLALLGVAGIFAAVGTALGV